MIIIDGVECYSPLKFRDVYFSDYGVTTDGDIYNIKTRHRMATWPGKGVDQYQIVSLFDDNGNKVSVSVHAAVYETLTGEYAAKNGYDIDHINGKRWDNRISNLQKLSHIENIQKSTLGQRRNKPLQTNISDDVARDICELLSQGVDPGAIVKLRGYSQQWVSGILNREYCLEISKNYTWNLRPKAGITIQDSVIHNICKDIAKGELSLRAIASKYGVSPTMVMDLRHGKRRSDITSQYDFSGKSDTEKLNLGPHEVAKPYVTKDGKPTNLIVTSSGRFFRAGTLKEQKPSIQHKDLCVTIKIDDGPKRNIPCKKVVAETFCENPYGFRDIINIDGNLYNLYPSNLKYVPHDVLCKQMMDTNVRRSYDGMGNPNAKITEDDVYSILHLYHDSNMKPKKIAKLYGLTKEAVVHICEGKSWFKQYSYFMNEKFKSAKKYNNQPLKIKLGTKQ